MTFLKIKCIKVFANGEMIIILRNGEHIIADGDKFIKYQTGETFKPAPLFDEFTGELVGFVD